MSDPQSRTPWLVICIVAALVVGAAAGALAVGRRPAQSQPDTTILVECRARVQECVRLGAPPNSAFLTATDAELALLAERMSVEEQVTMRTELQQAVAYLALADTLDGAAAAIAADR